MFRQLLAIVRSSSRERMALLCILRAQVMLRAPHHERAKYMW